MAERGKLMTNADSADLPGDAGSLDRLRTINALASAGPLDALGGLRHARHCPRTRPSGKFLPNRGHHTIAQERPLRHVRYPNAYARRTPRPPARAAFSPHPRDVTPGRTHRLLPRRMRRVKCQDHIAHVRAAHLHLLLRDPVARLRPGGPR